jgi:hypothetical protein
MCMPALAFCHLHAAQMHPLGMTPPRMEGPKPGVEHPDWESVGAKLGGEGPPETKYNQIRCVRIVLQVSGEPTQEPQTCTDLAEVVLWHINSTGSVWHGCMYPESSSAVFFGMAPQHTHKLYSLTEAV